MTEETESLILEILKKIQANVGDLKRGQEMAVERMASMENQLVQLRQDGVYTRADMARLEHRLDGVELRLELRGETP